MSRHATAGFRPGESGNPAGRLRMLKSRVALRRALLAAPHGDATVMQRWADEIVEQARTVEQRMAVLEFVEGGPPPRKGGAA